MQLDLTTTATLMGIAATASGGVGWIVHALVTPKITAAVKEHSDACHLRAALATEATNLARALEAEAKLRESGDERLEHTIERLVARIDSGFEALNSTLLRMASGNKL